MKIKEGMRISCRLFSTEITDAKFHREDDEGIDRWFICQNFADGVGCGDKLGYKYSYILPKGLCYIAEFEQLSFVENVKILDSKLDKIKSILEQIK